LKLGLVLILLFFCNLETPFQKRLSHFFFEIGLSFDIIVQGQKKIPFLVKHLPIWSIIPKLGPNSKNWEKRFWNGVFRLQKTQNYPILIFHIFWRMYQIFWVKKHVFCDFLKNAIFYPKSVFIFRFYDWCPFQKCILFCIFCRNNDKVMTILMNAFLRVNTVLKAWNIHDDH